MITEAVRNGMSVVVDEENLEASTWGVLTAKAKIAGASVEFHVMKATADECKKNASASIVDPDALRWLLTDIDRKAELFAPLLK